MAGKLVGWKYGAFIASVVGFTGLALYPIAIEPMMNADKWRNIQKEARGHYPKQESIQPGGKNLEMVYRAQRSPEGADMKVWSDPFERPKSS